MRWTAPLRQHNNMPNWDTDGTTAKSILAFAERQELAEAVEQLGFRRVLGVRYY